MATTTTNSADSSVYSADDACLQLQREESRMREGWVDAAAFIVSRASEMGKRTVSLESIGGLSFGVHAFDIFHVPEHVNLSSS
jgi:hypothetical protein